MAKADDNLKGEKAKRVAAKPVRLPGFISDEDIGLGDVIKRATASIGIRPCGGCARRAAQLNRWVAFKGRRSR